MSISVYKYPNPSPGEKTILRIVNEGMAVSHPIRLFKEVINKKGAILEIKGMEDFEINYVRKHLSLIKGGKLASLIYPAKIINLIISDDPGNIINAIAPGPTVPDSSTFEDACNVLKKYQLLDIVPTSVKNYLKKNIPTLAFFNFSCIQILNPTQ
jgi:glycerate-2-kinase